MQFQICYKNSLKTGTFNESRNSKNVVCRIYDSLGKPRKFMCTLAVLFLEFYKYNWFLEYKFFMKMCRIVRHFIFSKVHFVKMAHTTILHWPGKFYSSFYLRVVFSRKKGDSWTKCVAYLVLERKLSQCVNALKTLK